MGEEEGYPPLLQGLDQGVVLGKGGGEEGEADGDLLHHL